MVYVIDWFYQVIKQMKGGEVFMYQLNDLSVLNGIKFVEFSHPEHFTLRYQTSKLELLFNEKISYRAWFEPVKQFVMTNLFEACQNWSPWPWSAEEIYQRKFLFHGKSFQVIHKLIGINPEGCIAIIKTNQWQESSQLIDRALLDGGLQLALAWVRALLRKASIPTRIASVKYYKPLINSPFVTCMMIGKIKDGVRCQMDMQFYVDNDLIAEFKGLEVLSYME